GTTLVHRGRCTRADDCCEPSAQDETESERCIEYPGEGRRDDARPTIGGGKSVCRCEQLCASERSCDGNRRGTSGPGRKNTRSNDIVSSRIVSSRVRYTSTDDCGGFERNCAVSRSNSKTPNWTTRLPAEGSALRPSDTAVALL